MFHRHRAVTSLRIEKKSFSFLGKFIENRLNVKKIASSHLTVALSLIYCWLSTINRIRLVSNPR